MTAFQNRTGALTALVIATALSVCAQERPGGEPTRRRSQPPERTRAKQPAPEQERAKKAVREAWMPTAEIVVIPLKHANVWEVQNVLSAMRLAIGQRLLCDVAGGDSLVVATDDDQALAKVRALVAQLDKPQRHPRPAAKPDVCTVVQLKHAAACEVAEYLDELTPQRRSPARIVADERANTVWIAGEKEQVARIADLAKKMDENAAAAGLPEEQNNPELRFYSLAHAEPAALARMLAYLGDAMDLDVTVVPDQPSGTLVAYATPTEHDHLEMIIDKLDVPARQARKRPPAATPRKRGKE